MNKKFIFFILLSSLIFAKDKTIKDKTLIKEYFPYDYYSKDKYKEKFPVNQDKYYFYDDVLWKSHLNLFFEFDNQTKTRYTDKINHTWLSFYTGLNFKIGLFSFGLKIPLRFGYIYDKKEKKNVLTLDKSDWIIEGEPNLTPLELYLPLLNFLKFGEYGDNLYLGIKQIEKLSFGNGFLLDNYNNTMFFPEQRILGLYFNFDMSFFNFNYLGIESLITNITQADVFALRIYSNFDINKRELEVAFNIAFDRDPFYFAKKDIFNRYSPYYKDKYIINPETKLDINQDELVFLWGFDVDVPLFYYNKKNLYSMDLLLDFIAENKNYGASVGLKGRLAFFKYKFSIEIGSRAFIPAYLNTSYDYFKIEKFNVATLKVYSPLYAGFFSNIGLSFFDDKFNLGIKLRYQFKNDKNTLLYNPSYEVYLFLQEGILHGLFIDFLFKKEFIKSVEDFLSLKNTTIKTLIGYQFDVGIKLSFFYDFKPIKFLYKNKVPSNFLSNSGIDILWNIPLL